MLAETAGSTIETLAHTPQLNSCVPGFIGAYLFDVAGKATALRDTELASAFTAQHGWIWLHLNLADRRCPRWLAQTLGINSGIATDFSEPSLRQVILAKDGVLSDSWPTSSANSIPIPPSLPR